MRLRPGDRIRLIEMPSDPAPVEPGTEGVIGHVQENLLGDGRDQVSVEWDGPRKLSLVIPPDQVEVVGHEAVPEPWASIYAEACNCGVKETPEARERYGAELHSPYCPVGRREREGS